MKRIVGLMLIVVLALTGCGAKKVDNDNQSATTTEYSNDLFTMTLPSELVDISEVETDGSRISVYYKEAKDAGFGGLVFSVCAYASPDEYAGGPCTKIGELTTEKYEIYDIVLAQATEIQWDYNEPEMPDDYKKLIDAMDTCLDSIDGVDNNTYAKGAGTKGADLYKTVLAKYIEAINEGWEPAKYEEEDMSPEIGVAAMQSDNPLDVIGFAYQDINVDGIDELMVGVISEDELKGAVYDVYTMVNRVPEHVVSGTARDRYYNYNDVFLCNEWSGGAGENGIDLYNLESNSTELVLQYGYKYDSYTDPENPWYRTYDQEEYESITEEEYKEAEEMSDSYVLFDYTPLSKINDATTDDSADNGALPTYEYPGPELFYSVMYDYIADEFGANYDKADVGIPCPIIVAEDESDKSDIKVWGDFWYFNYTLNGDTLECVSGGSYPGCMHFKNTDEGYEVIKFEAVEDGSNFNPSAKKIFGENYDKFMEISSDDEYTEEIRAQIIANYVFANNLEIKAYKDYGWDPVELPKENIDSFYSNGL